MPYKSERDCPVCGKPDLLYLSDHLRQVHQLQAHGRKQWLRAATLRYETKKPRRILWYYSQWQDRYEAMKSSIGKDIQFSHGLPNFKDDLREIDPKFNNVLVFDDLMAQATDSPIVSRLFTQSRHRNAKHVSEGYVQHGYQSECSVQGSFSRS